MKYIGGWSANNGSTYNHGYESNNKTELARDMRQICDGNVFAGNTGHWSVEDEDGNIVLEGTCRN